MSGDINAPLELKEYRLCEKFGWTPKELDQQSVKTINHFLAIMSIENQLKGAEAKSGRH